MISHVKFCKGKVNELGWFWGKAKSEHKKTLVQLDQRSW